MSGGVCCVAGMSTVTQRMVRPLQKDGTNWNLGRDRSVFSPGHLLDCLPTGRRGTVMPHATEDTPLQSTPVVLERLSEEFLYSLLIGSAKPSVVRALSHDLLDGKYVEEGANCSSLGGMAVERRKIRFHDSGFGDLRLLFTDSDGTLYDLKVTSAWLQQLFSPSDKEPKPHFGVAEGNEWLAVNKPTDQLILRVGLARPWAGKEKQWNPRRCYVQLNGIVCPQDNYHIFAGSPGR